MPNDISSEGRVWTRQRTLSGSDSPNSTNYGDCWTSSANRTASVYSMRLLDSLLNLQNISTDCPYGIVETTKGNGYLFGLKASNGRTSLRNQISFSDQAYPGGVSTPMSTSAQCYSGSEIIYPGERGEAHVVISNTYYEMSSGSLSAGVSTAITVPDATGYTRLVHEFTGVGSAKVLVGGSDGGAPAITRNYLGGFTQSGILNSPSGSPSSVRSIAKTGAGEFLAAVDGSFEVLYSTDQGANFTYYDMDMGGVPQCVSYDSENGLWVAIRGDNGTVYTCPDPTTGTWTAEGTTSASPRDMICYGPLRVIVDSAGKVSYYWRNGDTWTGLYSLGVLDIDVLLPLCSRLALVSKTSDSFVTGVMVP